MRRRGTAPPHRRPKQPPAGPDHEKKERRESNDIPRACNRRRKGEGSKKAKDIRVLKVEDLTVLTDYFVIGTGSSATQVKALADEVEYQLGQAGVKPLRREGMDARNWILLDYGTVIVHVFYPETRDFYDLEHLWADATRWRSSFKAFFSPRGGRF